MDEARTVTDAEKLHLDYDTSATTADTSATTATVVNKGHTVVPNSSNTYRLHTASGTYELKQVHVHSFSEHAINGLFAPMEAHFVHAHIDNASQLAVGVMLRLQRDDQASPWVDSWLPKTPSGLDAMAGIDVTGSFWREMMDLSIGFWRYPGSLTTPGCNEIVEWHVLRKAKFLSVDQERTNNRLPEPLHGREVTYFSTDGSSAIGATTLGGAHFTSRVFLSLDAARSASAPLSRRRGRMLAGKAADGANALFNISSPFNNFGRMYTVISLGTPARSFAVNVDTSTSLSWVSCDCLQCPSSSTIVTSLTEFSTAASTTAKPVGCKDAACKQAPVFGCDQLAEGEGGRKGVCEYSLATNGTLVSDRIALAAADGSSTSAAASVMFGCARVRPLEDLDDPVAVDGVLGLGARSYSVLNQLAAAAVVPPAFALCFDSTSNSGFLSLGAPLVPPNVTTTDYVGFDNDTRYFLPLTQIRVGQTAVKGSAAVAKLNADLTGGFTVKSSYLSSGLRSAVHADLVKLVFANSSLRRADMDVYSCVHLTVFEAQDMVFPSIFLDVKEGTLEITPNNYLIKYGEDSTGMILCLSAIVVDDDLSNGFIGALWLRDLYLRFDLAKKKLAFRPLNCSAGEYFTSIPAPPPQAPPAPAAAPPSPQPVTPPFGGSGNGSVPAVDSDKGNGVISSDLPVALQNNATAPAGAGGKAGHLGRSMWTLHTLIVLVTALFVFLLVP
ncbi:unnamed protein product [Closterium sp. NIES-65]|nr:unnamed protein product [Closterium sp. NIES-65]